MKNINNKIMIKFLAFGAMIMSTMVTASCDNTGSDALKSAQIHAVGNENTLKKLVESSSTVYGYYTNEISGLVDDAVAPESSDKSSQERTYTDTNVQVEGVAEGDIVKTDGYNIYYAARYENKIRVFDVDDNHAITLSDTIDLEDVYTDALYLLDDYLVIIGYTYSMVEVSCGKTGEAEISDCISYMWGRPTGTVVVIDRDTLTTVYTLTTDSYFMDHRIIDDSLFLVGNKYLYYGYYNETELRPSFTETIGVSSETEYVDYENIYYYDDNPAYSMSILTGVKLDSNPNLISYNSAAYLGAESYYKQTYVSTNALYLCENVYHYEQNTSYDSMTISKFNIDVENATLEYSASCMVEGMSLNQFSMDEYNGYLRVATTNSISTWLFQETNWWTNFSRTVENHLYILKENTEIGKFELVGHLSEGLGHPGESIKSVRFDQDVAYIVTFVTTDPLYIINLSDPELPVITGEIEQLGYDTYQHVWGENQLLGIGYDATQSGQISGIKISAYNVEVGAETTLQTYTLLSTGSINENSWSYGYSEVLYNHKSLLVSIEDGIIGFPVVAYEYGYNGSVEDPYYGWYYTYHSYYYIFKIDFTATNPISDPIIIEHPTSNDYYIGVDRGVLIDGYIYTISNKQVITYSVNDNAVVTPSLTLD